MAKKKKPAKKAKAETKAEEKKARMTMAEIAPKHIETAKSNWIMTPDQFDQFAFPRLFTRLIDVDLVLRPTLGKRICIVGDESTGKTVMCHIWEGAAQHTCRLCFTPIIDWVHEETGEIKPKCRCGKNRKMVVVHLDIEDSFDPRWSFRWGIEVGDAEQRKGFKLRKSKDETFWVATPTEGEAAFNFVEDAVLTGAADFVVLDSLAMMVPGETISLKGETKGIGESRISPRARLVSEGVTRIIRAQVKAKLDFKARATVVWTNQFYLGPTRNPRQDPRREAAGKKAKYAADQTMRIITCVGEQSQALGFKKAYRFVKVAFKAQKSKSAGTAGGVGEYRLYLDNIVTKNGPRTAGETDEPDRLYAYLRDLGLFKQNGSKYECLGRSFTKVKDIRSFLSRPDIQYISRFFILRELLPVTALDYLEEQDYAYGAWGPDPAFALFREAASSGKTDLRGEPEGDGETGEGADWIDDEEL